MAVKNQNIDVNAPFFLFFILKIRFPVHLAFAYFSSLNFMNNKMLLRICSFLMTPLPVQTF